MMEPLYDILTWVLPLVIAITFHEAAHGFVAYRLGDDTAYLRGRVSFNPLKHIDRFGTIILPGLLFLMQSPFLFGYAKPVPVNFAALRHPRRDSALVALAGPGTNLLLALVSALTLHLESLISVESFPWLFVMLYKSVAINVLLAVFNMLPILPLDGGRVLASLLTGPALAYYGKSERYGILAVMLLLMLPGLLAAATGIDIPVFEILIGQPAEWLRRYIYLLANISQDV